jgi:hypothetical protein
LLKQQKYEGTRKKVRRDLMKKQKKTKMMTTLRKNKKLEAKNGLHRNQPN